MLPLIYHPNYSCQFPEDHRFVMSKFRRLYDYATETGLVREDYSNLFQPETASISDLSIAHDTNYLNGLVDNSLSDKEWRRIGLPWSQGLIDRTIKAPNGTLLAAEKAMEYGIACHLAGGTHHAHKDFGSGFCMVNDLAYTALNLVERNTVNKVLIFDCDVHQGDGTAAILEGNDNIFTCSIHCEKNFPFRKSKSDLDVGLPLDMEDDAYLEVVSDTFNSLLTSFKPDLVLYDAGIDVWEYDALGRLNISWQGMEQRDRLVLAKCLEKSIPVVTVIGGGYDKDHDRLARRHGIVIEQAAALVREF